MKLPKSFIGLAALFFCNISGFGQVVVQFPEPTIGGSISDGAGIPSSIPFFPATPTYQTSGKISYATNPPCSLSYVTLEYGKKKADGTYSYFTSTGNYPAVFNASFGKNLGDSNANNLVFDYSHQNSVGFNYGAYPIQAGETYAVKVKVTLTVPAVGTMLPVDVIRSKVIDKK